MSSFKTVVTLACLGMFALAGCTDPKGEVAPAKSGAAATSAEVKKEEAGKEAKKEGDAAKPATSGETPKDGAAKEAPKDAAKETPKEGAPAKDAAKEAPKDATTPAKDVKK